MSFSAVLLVLVGCFGYSICDNIRRCYQCIGAQSFRGCMIQTCKSTETHCYFQDVWTISGQHYVLAGCHTDTVCSKLGGKVQIDNTPSRRSCTKCCDGDLCNKPLCSTSVPVGPHCFSCDGVSSVRRCHEMSICKYGEHCSMEVYDKGENHLQYHGGCSKSDICTAHSFPARAGHNICSECCNEDFCNSEVCGAQDERRRQCYQCYDQKVGEINQCFKKVECAHSTSKCTQVLRNESGIATFDMDCEENLPCTSTVGTDHDVCDICCNWDFCNREVDCRYPVTMTTGHTTLPTTVSTPKQCYQCSDVRVDSMRNNLLCYNVVTCTNPTSRCSSVYHEEDGITIVDMGCEEQLSCNEHYTTSGMCRSCCDTDLCNQDLDCRPHKATTTTPTSTRNFTGVECEVCSGAECGVDSRRAVSVRCNNTTPYCLNTVLNDVNGDKHVTKRCGSVSECESKWQQKSSLLEDCLNFDPSNIYSHSFECTYCCVTHNCNRNIRPQTDTLYNQGVDVYLP